LRKNHGNGLSEHDGFSLNTSYTPSSNTKSIDHGCMGVSSNNGVRVKKSTSVEDNGGEVFKINLMNNT
jgi:hypothetical protein